MSEFKVGDEVYEVHAYPIRKCNIIFLPSRDTGGYYMLGNDFHVCPPQEIYKTKNEAINAMIKKLEKLRSTD